MSPATSAAGSGTETALWAPWDGLTTTLTRQGQLGTRPSLGPGTAVCLAGQPAQTPMYAVGPDVAASADYCVLEPVARGQGAEHRGCWQPSVAAAAVVLAASCQDHAGACEPHLPAVCLQLRHQVSAVLQAMHEQARWYTQACMAGLCYLGLACIVTSACCSSASWQAQCLSCFWQTSRKRDCRQRQLPSMVLPAASLRALQLLATLKAPVCRGHVQSHCCGSHLPFRGALPSQPRCAKAAFVPGALPPTTPDSAKVAACRCVNDTHGPGSTFSCPSWTQVAFPFGSEFAWDSTGQVGAGRLVCHR